jgi:1-acyl-sn-glycerol-3-phosphate acyltransferase
MLSYILSFLRLLAFISFVSFFSIAFYIASFFWSKETSLHNGIRLRNFLIKGLNVILGIRATVYGKIPSVQGLIVANHRSYFDPILMLNHKLTFPVGKKEVESWPIIGYICRISGVIFVDRKDPKSRQETSESIKDALSKGYSVINFPEGTTHDLPTTVAFNYGSFAMASKNSSAVIPVAIDYKEKTDAFIGDDTFVPHFLKCFGKLTTEIKITYFPPVYSEDVEFLLNTSKEMIDNELIRYRKDWDSNI